MSAKVSDAGKVKVVALDGRIVWGSGCDDLTALVKKLLSEDHRRMVLDLTGVTMMDSGGVGAMATCKQRAMAKDAGIVIVVPANSRITMIVQTTLAMMFPTYRDEKSAIGSFAK